MAEQPAAHFQIALLEVSEVEAELHPAAPERCGNAGDAGVQLDALAADGVIVIGDTFRPEGFRRGTGDRPVGGGHPVAAFRAFLAQAGLRIEAEEDVTDAVAPSIDLEQAFFNVGAISDVEAKWAQIQKENG